MVFEVIRDHLTPKLGVFGVIWGQNPNIFKPRQIIYQNEPLGPVTKKKWFSRSSEVIWPQNWAYLGSFGVKIQTFSNLDKLHTKMNLLVPWWRKNHLLLSLSLRSRQLVERSLLLSLSLRSRQFVDQSLFLASRFAQGNLWTSLFSLDSRFD